MRAMAAAFYANLFVAEGSVGEERILGLMDVIVTPDMNENLTKSLPMAK